MTTLPHIPYALTLSHLSPSLHAREHGEQNITVPSQRLGWVTLLTAVGG